MKYRRHGLRSHSLAFRILPLLVLLLPAVSALGFGEPEPGDVVFRTINATTGEPCILDRLIVQESTPEMETVARTEPTAPVFTLSDVPLVDPRGYIATAWFRDVPYYWEFRGRFLDQDTNTVHVFDTTPTTEGVVVSGLNLIVTKQGELVKLEYVLQVDNRILPQKTVVNASAVIELPLPAGASNIEANYHRGPSPTPIPTRQIGEKGLELNLPLTPGVNRIHVQAMLEWRDALDIPVGCSLPIEAWSLLGRPDYLDFTSFELEPDTESDLTGVSRYVGPPLAAGREISIRVGADRAPAPQENLFAGADSAAADETKSADEKGDDGGMPLPLPILAVLLIVVIVVILRRRRS